MSNQMKQYRFNLVSALREQERKSAKLKRLERTVGAIAFSLLLTASLFFAWRIVSMKMVINEQQKKITALEQEYQTYQATQMVVSKADIELLDRLQSNRIFWTKHFESVARNLPVQYWLNRFSYRSGTFEVFGKGIISARQEQVVTIDGYLNVLRNDPTINSVFDRIYFNSVVRVDEPEALDSRVTFNFSALKKGGQNDSIK